MDSVKVVCIGGIRLNKKTLIFQRLRTDCLRKRA
jgi:hypothetical protein